MNLWKKNSILYIILLHRKRRYYITPFMVSAGQLVSEFTPANPITAFEILPAGEFVVVACSGAAHPTVLQLRGGFRQPQQPSVATESQKTYGDETTLEVDLSSDFRDDAAAAAMAAGATRWQPPPDDDTVTAAGRRGRGEERRVDAAVAACAAVEKFHNIRTTFPAATAIRITRYFCWCDIILLLLFSPAAAILFYTIIYLYVSHHHRVPFDCCLLLFLLLSCRDDDIRIYENGRFCQIFIIYY